jgi:hypothetical protein
MDDEQKTKKQLVKELRFLRERAARLKESERNYREGGEKDGRVAGMSAANQWPINKEDMP